MAEFEDADLRPFSGFQRPTTGAYREEDGDDPSRGPAAGRPGSSASVRPSTSVRMAVGPSRPGTAVGVPDWLIEGEDGVPVNRPKTGYRNALARQEAEDRPFSRQGSAIGDRPYTGRAMTARAGSAYGRPGSSMAVRAVPGTASRLVETAMKNRPMSRTGIGLQTPVNVADRPVTQQGLTGLKTAAGRGPQRQFQDKSYFLGALRTKMTELTAEIGRLSREVEAESEEQSTYLAYDKRVKELASQLTQAQGELADYNLLVDKLNTDTERVEVEMECENVKVGNQQTAQEVEGLWEDKREMEKRIAQLELELEQERNMADNLVSAMQPELRERFLTLKNANIQYMSAMEGMNQELDVLNSRKALLEDEMAVSAMKREAVRLYEILGTTEAKRDALLQEEENRGTPQQERERLLEQVKDDNSEISIMERQIAEASEKIRMLSEEKEQLESEVEENQSEKNQKYRELKKREETMDEFLASFQENKQQELARLAELENGITEVLERMSRNLSQVGHLPSSSAFSNMKEDLAFKEGEVEKSRNTLEGLTREHQQLNLNLEKIEALEDKIKAEMTTLKDKMRQMEEDIETFSDLDKLRREAEEKRRQLEADREELISRRDGVMETLEEIQTKHDGLKKTLNDNETYVQLTNLERKWQMLEQNNFAVSEFILNKKAESNFEAVKNKVMKLQWEYNKMLQESLKKQ